MGRLQLLRYCKFRKSPEQRSNGEMIKKKKKKKGPQGSASAVIHSLRTANVSVSMDGCLTRVEKIFSDGENSKDLNSH